MSILFGSKKSRAYVLLFLDSIIHIVSLIIAGSMRHGIHEFIRGWLPMTSYISTTVMIVIFYALIYGSQENGTQDIIEQGAFYALSDIIKKQFILFVFIMTYLFITKQGQDVSRYIIVLFTVTNCLLEFLLHLIYKKFVFFAIKNKAIGRKVLLITLSDRAEHILRGLDNKINMHDIMGIVLLDCDQTGSMIEGVPVIGKRENLMETHKEYVYDEVFIHIPYDYDFSLEAIIMGFEQIGITVSLNIDVFNLAVEEKKIARFGPYNVIAFQSSADRTIQMLCKRMMDIVGSIIGLLITGILFLILGPVIKIQSPGPVFFSQIRVGKNGRKFKMYKFRSMYVDAEARKAELMSQNEMQGLMFKMKNDPRVTPIGRFIRKTSLDEFPQFLNVLKGDMSLVGTRPPTEDEYNQYDVYHLKRLSIKPGITGLWQVSGKNNVCNFEDVIRLDFQYIDQWSLLWDIKILLQTIGVVFGMNKEWKKECTILNVHISAVNMEDTVRYIRTHLKELSGKYICVANVHTTVMSYQNEEYLAIQNGASMVLPDGKPLSIVARKRGCQTIDRVTGPDLMGEIFKISSWNGYRHFFYGSSEKTLEMLKEKLEAEYPEIQIAGMISPPYRELTQQEDEAFVQKINEAQADFVWIGLGAPKQEYYMAAHKGQIHGVMIGVGAGFDYYAGNIKRAPIWMQNCSLEWLYRLIQDPKKLWKRYLSTNFLFMKLVRKENKRLRQEKNK